MSAERYQTKEKAAVEVYGKVGISIASVKNLSKTGACIECPEMDFNLQKGDLIRMTVHLKALNRKHKMSAEVVWSEGSASGIQFLSSDELLDKIVDRGI